jgi:drug/metabolite transporter (DMT)-like permease
MTFLALSLILIALVTFVWGQIFLKHAMAPGQREISRKRFAWLLTAGISLMTISFFLTLGLLQRYDLSYLYPFQGLSTIIISGMAAVFLKERVTLRLTIGALLISAGVILVSLS